MRLLLISLAILHCAPSLALTAQGHRAVALTFDDLPEVLDWDLARLKRNTHEILRTLKVHQAPAIGFVNEGKLHKPGEIAARIAVLKQWVDRGMILGNHTYSHARFQTTPLPQYEKEMLNGEVITRRLMRGHQPYQLYFRYPYSSTGPNLEAKEAFEKFLEDHRYKVAPFTIENFDYIFNRLYVDAKRDRDTTLMDRLRQDYLEFNDLRFEFFERLSKEMFGREISQILLIHANDINADCLDQLLARLEARGYRFVTLDRAMEDEAYRTKDNYVDPVGISWLHRWAVSLGLPMKLREQPVLPQWVLERFNKRQG